MSHGEADTRAKLIDPALHTRGWTEDLIRREETAGAIEIIEGKPRKRSKGRVDYTLRVRVNPDTQPVAVALIEAKKDGLPPGHGLDQAKGYATCKRLNVPFVFSTNGHLFVEFNRFTGLTSAPRPLAASPSLAARPGCWPASRAPGGSPGATTAGSRTGRDWALGSWVRLLARPSSVASTPLYGRNARGASSSSCASFFHFPSLGGFSASARHAPTTSISSDSVSRG